MTHPVSPATPINAQAARELQQMAASEAMMIVEAQEDFEQYVETSPFVIYQRFLPLAQMKNANERSKYMETQETKGQKVHHVESAEEAAQRFERNNEELKARILLILREGIRQQDTAEELLNKALKVYTDHSLADEALDFLVQTTEGQTQETAKAAKERLNTEFGREVKSGRNMGLQAREFAKEGLGTPTSLRALYRDLTGTPREPLKLFEELTQKFAYDKLKTAINFLLHALGADLKSKGPSIARGELKRLLDETRSLQGILGIFRFFQSRMRLIQREFASYDLAYPTKLNFESLSKIFVKLLLERFVNAEKILQFAKLLGFSDEIIAQIIILTQYRDAIRQVAPRYFRNPQHQAELLKALIEAIEELEEKEEEEEK